MTISVDDGIQPNTSMSGLAKLKPNFKKGGNTTAGRVLNFRIPFYLVSGNYLDTLT